MDTQLKKGLLEFCVLAALEEKDSYGYELIKKISVCEQISESTLYPLLRRVELAGYVASYKMEHNNRIRNYFQLTFQGKEYLNTFRENKNHLMQILDFIGDRMP